MHRYAMWVIVASGCYQPAYDPAQPGPDRRVAAPIDTTVSSCATIPRPPPPAIEDGSPQQMAEHAGLTALDQLVGTYLRGEIRVFKGTMVARDNASTLLDSQRPDGVIARGPAVARLVVGPSNAGDWYPAKPAAVGTTSAVLVLHGVADHAYVALEQTDAAPSVTWVSSVAGDRSTSHLQASCDGCVPDLVHAPARLAFELDARGPVSIDRGATTIETTADVRVSVDLAAAPPCSLTIADLMSLNTIASPNTMIDFGFVRDHDRYIGHGYGSIGLATAHKCSTTRTYTYDLVIDPHDLGAYTVRNFQLHAPQSVCAP